MSTDIHTLTFDFHISDGVPAQSLPVIGSTVKVLLFGVVERDAIVKAVRASDWAKRWEITVQTDFEADLLDTDFGIGTPEVHNA